MTIQYIPIPVYPCKTGGMLRVFDPGAHKKHITTCPTCRAYWAEQQRLAEQAHNPELTEQEIERS
jgi:Pyruvate/2-oxoacid:ferredoxin oxidoreductase delta subunit